MAKQTPLSKAKFEIEILKDKLKQTEFQRDCRETELMTMREKKECFEAQVNANNQIIKNQIQQQEQSNKRINDLKKMLASIINGM